MIQYNSIVIHYGEIALKRGKRPHYEKLLKTNLEKKLGRKLRRLRGRLVLRLGGDDWEILSEDVRKVFGVVWFAPAIHIKRDVEELEQKIIEVLRQESVPSFKICVKRSDKTFPLTSIQLAESLGRSISSKLNLRVDLENPDRVIYIHVTEDGFYLFFEKIRGLGGLPTGSSGKILSLLSGGIDSPVAAWLMMKRGCNVDLLHIHSFLSDNEVLETKIGKIAKILSEYSLGLKLYLASFKPFLLRSFDLPPKMVLVSFRAYMTSLADRIARSRGYLGIVTGDSLGQVASQTLENLYAVSFFSQTPIYRPLVGMDKQEIIDLAKKIGTYQFSIQEYRDCCAIVARHPETKADMNKLRELWEKHNLEEAVEETLTNIAEYEL